MNKLIIILLSLFLSHAARADEFDISEFSGQTVYLDFWASWCGPCRESFPFMNQLQHDYQNRGLKVLAINLDEDPAQAQKFLKQFPAEFEIRYDPQGQIASNYKIQGMPSSYLFDKHGQLVSQHIGFRKDDPKKIRKQIDGLIGAQ